VRTSFPDAPARAALAILPAALWAVGAWGRTGLAGMSARWALTFLAAWLVAFIWARRGGAVGLLPAAAFSGALLLPLYASPDAYHAWTFTATPKGLALPVSALLVALSPMIGVAATAGREAAIGTLRAFVPALIAAGLFAFGALQALSFSQVATDDLIRYWGIADAWAAGAPYAVTEGLPGSSSFYLVDQPVYPALVALAFQLVGHRYLALHLPLVLANTVLPLLLYGTAREAGAARPAALAVALLVVAFPPYQVYALSSAEPDPLWAALLAGMTWLALRCARPSGATARTWIALGAMTALLVLTRPEGILYAGPLFLGLLWHAWREQRVLRHWLLAATVAGVPVVAFSGFLLWTFGIVWPTGWGSVASLRYVLPNAELVLRQNLPNYAATAALPSPTVTGPLIALVLVAWFVVGTVVLWRRFPGLRLFLLPVAANLAVIFMSPTYLAADHLSPPTFFRHFAILVPWLIPPLAAVLTSSTLRTLPPTVGATACTLLLAAELAVLGSTASRNQSGVPTVLTSDPYVLFTDLWRAEDRLPNLPFLTGAGRGVFIDPNFPYMAFRSGLFEAMRPYDLHVNDAGRAYTLASAVIGAGTLLAAAGASRALKAQPVGRRSTAPAPIPTA
jgi:hypothetical protein